MKISQQVLTKNSGQAIVEYILLAALLLFIVLAANRLLSGALSGYFHKIAILRSGITGMGP